ncbi:MAG TPA: hypothetical protein VND64_35265 [Pirellulales bacterium]|nr:hypothetical protein [Pirellulales bacterium]
MRIERRALVAVAAVLVGAVCVACYQAGYERGQHGKAFEVAGFIPNAAADDDKPNNELEEKAERQRVIACGLTEAEADCWVLVSKSAAKFFELPKLHPMDDHEVAHATHIVQSKLLSRPTYRKYMELLKNQQE